MNNDAFVISNMEEFISRKVPTSADAIARVANRDNYDPYAAGYADGVATKRHQFEAAMKVIYNHDLYSEYVDTLIKIIQHKED